MEKTSDSLLKENYVDLLWGEFTRASKEYKVLPLYSAFSIIEASARLGHPKEEATTKERFIWWIENFMPTEKFKYNAIDLYGARCGLFHEFGAESDLSRKGQCAIILWAIGGSSKHLHGKRNPDSKQNLYFLHRETFFEDLRNAGIHFLESLIKDQRMNQRVSKRLPNLFGVAPKQK